jgi:hypothetical protein
MVRSREPRVKLVSARVPTWCAGCGAARELDVQAGGKLPPCPACGGALGAKISPAAWQLIGPAEPERGTSRRGRAGKIIALAALLLVVAGGGAAAFLPRGVVRVRPPVETVPAWANGGVVGDGELIFVPGQGQGPSGEAALRAAKADAVAKVGEWLAAAAPPGDRQEEPCKLARRPLPDAAASARIIGAAAAGAMALTEEVTKDGTVHARFALPKEAADHAREALQAEATALGMTVARCGEALVVTAAAPGEAAHRAGVRAGDVLVEVDGAAPGSPKAVADAASEAGAEKELRLTVEVGGARRTVRLRP